LLWGLLRLLSTHWTRSPMLDTLQTPQFSLLDNTSLETVCILLLDLVVALTKFLLVYSSLLKIHFFKPILFHDSLSESFSLTSFVTSFPCWFWPSCSYSGQKTCSWQYNRTPTVVKDLCYSRNFSMSLYPIKRTPVLQDKPPQMPALPRPCTHSTGPVGTTPGPPCHNLGKGNKPEHHLCGECIASPPQSWLCQWEGP